MFSVTFHACCYQGVLILEKVEECIGLTNEKGKKNSASILFLSSLIFQYIYLISCIPIISKIKPSTLINQSPKDVIILFMYLHNVIPGNILVTSGDYVFFATEQTFWCRVINLTHVFCFQLLLLQTH